MGTQLALNLAQNFPKMWLANRFVKVQIKLTNKINLDIFYKKSQGKLEKMFITCGKMWNNLEGLLAKLIHLTH